MPAGRMPAGRMPAGRMPAGPCRRVACRRAGARGLDGPLGWKSLAAAKSAWLIWRRCSGGRDGCCWVGFWLGALTRHRRARLRAAPRRHQGQSGCICTGSWRSAWGSRADRPSRRVRATGPLHQLALTLTLEAASPGIRGLDPRIDFHQHQAGCSGSAEARVEPGHDGLGAGTGQCFARLVLYQRAYGLPRLGPGRSIPAENPLRRRAKTGESIGALLLNVMARTRRIGIKITFGRSRNCPSPSSSGSTRGSASARRTAGIEAVHVSADPRVEPEDDGEGGSCPGPGLS